MPILTVQALCSEAALFSVAESQHPEPLLYGITDGKAVGTYLEQKFKLFLKDRYEFVEGNSASGIDFPELLVDVKVTSIKQPQSSCPFKSARQKIFGLGYSLIIFVYDKTDDSTNRTAALNILHTIFGVGAYTFTPWKIAICGLYKKLGFRLVGKINNKPAVFDDTVYFLSFDEEEAALRTFELLNSPSAINFYSSLIFWDKKRPIKFSILNSLNLTALVNMTEFDRVMLRIALSGIQEKQYPD